MSQSSRKDQKPRLVKDEYELLKAEWEFEKMIGDMSSVDDSIIAFDNYGTLELVDFDATDNGRLPPPLLEVKDTTACCLSEGREILVALSGKGIRVWHLDEEKNLRTIKLADGRFIEIDFPADAAPGRNSLIFFIGGNSHIIARQILPSLNYKTYLIEVSTGKITEIATLEKATDYCLLGKDRLISAQEYKGICVHKILSSAKGITISEGEMLISEPNCEYLRCAASPDGTLLAGAGWDDRVNLVTIKRWAILNKDVKLQEIDESPCLDRGDLYILFNKENFLIYQNRESRMCMLAPDSHEPIIFTQATDPRCCALPNGNIAVLERFLRVYSVPHVMYKQALTEFAQAIEVSEVTKLPRMLGGVIASYAAEYSLFSIPKEIHFHCSDNPYTREVLNTILVGLKNGKRVTAKDKSALTSLVNQPGAIKDCTEVVLKMPGITEELKNFLINLKEIFSPQADQKTEQKFNRY